MVCLENYLLNLLWRWTADVTDHDAVAAAETAAVWLLLCALPPAEAAGLEQNQHLLLPPLHRISMIGTQCSCSHTRLTRRTSHYACVLHPESMRLYLVNSSPQQPKLHASASSDYDVTSLRTVWIVKLHKR